LPELGLEHTPWLAVTLQRDKYHRIIATSFYIFTVPRDFHASSPMICPHFALLGVLPSEVCSLRVSFLERY
jgi:hypothetical protein